LASKLSASSATGVLRPRPPTTMLSGLARAASIFDWYFCLGGCLRIEMRASPAEELLAAGETYSTPPGTAHLISNGDDVDDCRFLLLQGVGIYDFKGVGN
jgi:hypothetical protein